MSAMVKVIDVAAEGGFTADELDGILRKHQFSSGSPEELELLKKMRAIFLYHKKVLGRDFASIPVQKQDFLDAGPREFDKIYDDWVKEAGKT